MSSPLAAATALALGPPGLVAVWGEERSAIRRRGDAHGGPARCTRRRPPSPAGAWPGSRCPTDAAEAADAVRRASSRVTCALVTALAGARPPQLEELVAEHDLAIVAADAETALARAALARLHARGIDARACPPPRRGPQRTIALAGLAASMELA